MFVGIYFVFCALSSLQLINGAATKTNDSTIVFHGPTQDVSNRLGTADVPEECKDKNFCHVKPDDYPQELFNKLLKGKFKEQPFQPTYVTADRRAGGDSDGIDDCDTIVTFEPLYKVKTNDDWHTVVQAPEENFVQKARIESCKKIGSSCFTGFKLPLLGMETLCTQKYAVWEFLVHDGKDGTQKVRVDLPTCCSCRYWRSES